MRGYLGELSLELFILLILVQLVGSYFWKHAQARKIISLLYVGQFGCILFSFLLLVNAYLVSDFSLANVVNNSHTAKPLLYKLAGTWGNHEGSMLLWLLISSLYGIFFLTRFERKSLGNYATGVFKGTLCLQSIINLGFGLYILLASNPFEVLEIPPQEGLGLNPLLQDPALAFHPPLLYFGYVGFSLPFSFTLSALWHRLPSILWVKAVRFWVLLAWACLTLGIMTGSWWAYYELGWGGWWFWDPVENSALLPWIFATALFHMLNVIEKQRRHFFWGALLVLLTFGLSLLGTFLVRAGVLMSVHSFATDPIRGAFILVIISIILLIGFIIFFLRPFEDKKPQIPYPIFSRTKVLLVNNILLCSIGGIIFLGTLLPLFIDFFLQQKVSIGAPYFNATVIPLTFILMCFMGLAPFLKWSQKAWGKSWLDAQIPLSIALVSTIVFWCIYNQRPVLGTLAFGGAMWVLFASLHYWVKALKTKTASLTVHAMTLSHLGFGLLVLGMTVDVFGMKQVTIDLSPNQEVMLDNYRLKFKEVKVIQGPNYRAERATVEVYKKNTSQIYTQLYPEKRFFTAEKSITAEVALKTVGLSELYFVLGNYKGNQTWTFRFYYHPLVNLIWCGALLMALGGLVRLRRPH